MNLKLLHKITQFVEMLFKRDAPIIGQAAIAAAVGVAAVDPKVQSITNTATAFIAAAHDLNAALKPTPPDPADPSSSDK